MEKKLIIGSDLLEIVLQRLCQEVIENHPGLENTVIIGLQPRGVDLAKRIQKRLEKILQKEILIGNLDVTFYRDDFRRRPELIQANQTQIPFIIEQKKVILVDDVLYTGRTVRSAFDAILAFGRPAKVELLVLVNRLYTRHLPIEPHYTGREVNTLDSQRVLVEWESDSFQTGEIWLTESRSSKVESD